MDASMRCRWGWHDYECIDYTGKHAYEECLRCQRRRIRVLHAGGHQPINRDWLEATDNYEPYQADVVRP